MKKRAFIILSLIVLLSFQILAVDIQLRKGGQELDYVSYGLIQNVDINIIPDSSEFSELTVDLTSLDVDSISLTPSSCDDESGVFRCVVRRDIRIISETAIITGTVDEVSFEVVKTFNIDNIAPELISITTDYCLADKCYLKPGPGILYLDISEGESGLNNANIYLSVLGSQVKAFTCEGNVCKVAVTVPETNSFSAQVIQYLSTDDAGNSLTGLSSETIYVDREDPEILEFNISSSSEVDLFSVDDSLIVNTVVREERTEPRIFLDMSNFGIDELIEGSCSLGEVNWDCEVTSNFGIDYARTDSVEVIVKDLLNNFDNYTKEIEVLGLTGTEEPSKWNLASLQVSPDKINKRNLILNRNIHAYLTLSTSGTSEIIDAKTDVVCFSGGAEGSSNSDLKEMHVVNPSIGERSFYIKGIFLNNVDNYEGFDFVNYSCYIEVLSKKGTLLESNYEKIWFDFEIKFDKKSRVDTELLYKLNSSRSNLEKYQETISDLAKYVRIAKGLCAGSMLLDTVSSVFSTGTGAAAAAEQKGLQATFGKVSEVSGKGGEKLHWACNVVNCNYTNSAIKQMTGVDVNSNTDSLVNSLPGIDYFKKAADVNDIAPVLDPYRSVIVAGVTMCLPAIIVHGETLLVNECHYAGCLERSAYLGMPSGTCDMSKSYNQCLFVSGAALDAVPYTALLRVLSSKLAQITEDPYGFIAAGAVTLVCSNEAADFLVGKEGGLLYSACMVANKVSQLGKIVPIYNDIKSNFMNPTAQSKCDSLTSGYSLEQLTWELSHQPTEFEDFTNTYELENGETMSCGFNGCVYGDFLIKFNLEFDKDGNLEPDSLIDASDMEFFVIQDDGTSEYIDIDSAWETIGDIVEAQGGILEVDAAGQPIPPEFDPDTVDITRLTAEGTVEEIDQAFGTTAVDEEAAVESIQTMINNDEAMKLFVDMGFINSDGTINVNNVKNIKFFKDTQKQGFIDVYSQYQQAVDLGTAAEFREYHKDQLKVAGLNTDISNREKTIVEIKELGEDIVEIEEKIVELEEEWLAADENRRREIEAENTALNEKLDETKESYDEKTKDGDIEDLEKEIEKLEENLEDAEESEEVSGKFLARKTLHHSVHGNFLSWKTWGNFLDLGRAASTIAGFFHDQTEEDWLDDVQEFVRIPAEFERKICEDNLNSPGTSGSVMVASRSGLMPAAMLYGSRSEISSSEWEYIVAVDIQNLKESGLKFKILLEEPGSEEIELNNDGETIIELAAPDSFTRKGSGALYFSENKAYTNVCINFINSNLGVYFDDYSLPNNKLCQELIIE